MRHWLPARVEEVFRHRILRLERHRLAHGEETREALVLQAPDWVNVIATLPDGQVLLVRQWRYGIAAPTLEIPGGMVEEADHQAAAERELLEETGYRAGRWQQLGELHPNPAFIANRIVTFLATDLEKVEEPQGDGEEEITVESAPLAEIPGLIRRGTISHSLVVAAFYLLDHVPAPAAAWRPARGLALAVGLGLVLGAGACNPWGGRKADEEKPLPIEIREEHPVSTPGIEELLAPERGAGGRGESAEPKAETPAVGETAGGPGEAPSEVG